MFYGAIAVTLLVFQAAILASLVTLIVGLARTARQVRHIIVDFISSADSQTPSPLATTVDQMAQVVSRAVIAQFQTSVMGKASAAAKSERAAISQAILAKYPWVGTLAGLVPGLSKNMLKNPALLNLVAQMGSRVAGSPGAPAPTNGGKGIAPPQFDL